MYGTLEKKKEQAGGDSAGEQSVSKSRSTSASLNRNESSPGRLDSSPNKRRRRANRKIFSHCHMSSDQANGGAEGEHEGVDKSARRRLIVASVICLVFMIGEVVGGVLSGSLAIATDAAHLLTDFASFMISLFAIWLSSRPASRKMSFGWYRAEVIGALISVLMIWLVTGLLVYMAVERLRTGDFEIDATVMVITAGAGLLVNIIMAIALNVDGHGHGHFHGHSHGHAHKHAHDHQHDIRSHSHLAHMNEDDDDDDDDGDEHQVRGLEDAHLDSSFDSKRSDLATKSLIVEPAHGAKQKPDFAQLSLPNGTNERQNKSKVCREASKKAKHQQQGRGRSNINVRAAFIHVIGDFLQSLGVLIAALVIYFEPNYSIVDPICTFLFSIIVLVTTLNIIRDATNVLMEGIPDGINFIEVREQLQTLPGVVRVHNLRIWSLSLDKIAISTHLVIDASQVSSSRALKSAITTLKSRYSFFEVTIQIEEYREDMKDCGQCQDEDDDDEDIVINVPDNQQQQQQAVRQPNDGSPA